jgi:hypothetical protein
MTRIRIIQNIFLGIAIYKKEIDGKKLRPIGFEPIPKV